MKFQELQKCRVEARTADIRQQMVYDTSAKSYTDTPKRDDEGRCLFTTEVDIVSDIENAMVSETLTIHALEAPVLQLTELHQQLEATNLRMEFWRNNKGNDFRFHCDWLQVAGAKSAKA